MKNIARPDIAMYDIAVSERRDQMQQRASALAMRLLESSASEDVFKSTLITPRKLRRAYKEPCLAWEAKQSFLAQAWLLTDGRIVQSKLRGDIFSPSNVLIVPAGEIDERRIRLIEEYLLDWLEAEKL